MSETPKNNNPIIIISLVVLELLSIEELMVVGRRSG